MLFHYDGNVDGWRTFEWSNSVIHISALNQTKWYSFYLHLRRSCFSLETSCVWTKTILTFSECCENNRWFAKRFLHPDIVAEYSYIFLWDEDLGVEKFNPNRYVKVGILSFSLFQKKLFFPFFSNSFVLTFHMTCLRSRDSKVSFIFLNSMSSQNQTNKCRTIPAQGSPVFW